MFSFWIARANWSPELRSGCGPVGIGSQGPQGAPGTAVGKLLWQNFLLQLVKACIQMKCFIREANYEVYLRWGAGWLGAAAPLPTRKGRAALAFEGQRDLACRLCGLMVMDSAENVTWIQTRKTRNTKPLSDWGLFFPSHPFPPTAFLKKWINKNWRSYQIDCAQNSSKLGNPVMSPVGVSYSRIILSNQNVKHPLN